MLPQDPRVFFVNTDCILQAERVTIDISDPSIHVVDTAQAVASELKLIRKLPDAILT